MARIAILRHGQTDWSLAGKHTSTTDVDLTDLGVRQAVAVPELLTELRITPATVLVSPRLRARRTAELARLTVDDVDADLAEWSYGDYEGRTTPEIRESAPGWQIFDDGAPGGESVEQVRLRVDRVLDRARAALLDGDVLLACHGHIGRVLAVRWVGLPVAAARSIALDPAGVTVLGAHHGEPIIDHANYARPLPT